MRKEFSVWFMRAGLHRAAARMSQAEESLWLSMYQEGSGIQAPAKMGALR